MRTPLQPDRVRLGTTAAIAWMCSCGLLSYSQMVVYGQPQDTVEISVDFAALGEPVEHRATGILHSFSTTDPTDPFVEPLGLKAFRGRANDTYLLASGFYDRLQRLGIEHVQVVLSDSYGYPNGLCGWPSGSGGLGCWELIVDQTVRSCVTRQIAAEYDIWNEPDVAYFWGLDRPAWLEVWRRGVLKVRQTAPGAPVVGPSISHFDTGFLREFLVFAKANNCLPDVISWHELSASNGRAIPTHVRQVRDLLAELQIEIPRLSINEIIPNNRQYNPGTAVSYFAGIEQTTVESACHSCWGDVQGTNCENCSLNGLLVKDPTRPRGAWWAYKFYADLRGRHAAILNPTFTAKCRADVLAACEPDSGTATLLVGSYETTRTLALEILPVHLETIPGLSKTGRVRAAISYVPNNGADPVLSPTPRTDQVFSLSLSQQGVLLDSVEPGSVLFVRLSADPGP